MSEREPDQPQPEQPCDPSDVYAVDLGADGIEHVEKLRPSPQIWVGSWADYNNGILHGQWIDAARDVDELQADIATMLTASPIAQQNGLPSEEWGVFDYDGFGQARIGEQPSLEFVTQVAQGIFEHGLAFAAFAANENGGELPNDFTERYLGRYESVEGYVEQLIDELGYDQLLDEVIPESLRPYVQIDVEGLARDMQLGGDIWATEADDGGIWVFDGR